MNKPIMNVFGETPIKSWMKLYAKLMFQKDSFNTIYKECKENNIKEFNLRIKKTNRGYVLSEGHWESKKTLYDYLSYLNQFNDKKEPIKIHIWNDRPFGNCDFILDMINIKRSFKKLDIATIMLRDDDNNWWSITNQLD